MIRKFLFTLALVLLTGISVAAQSTPGTVRYPSALDDLDSLIRVKDNASTTLTLTVNASATSITVGSTANFPTTGSLVMGSEICYYTAKTSNTFSGLLRGRDGTTAAGHPAGRLVRGPVLATHHNTQSSAIIAIENKLGHGAGNAADAPTGACPKKNADGTTTWVLCVQSSDLNGLNGAGLTGLGSAGGIINTGSTTIGADSDSDGVGGVSLQTKGIERVSIDPDGTLKGSGIVKALGGENVYAHGAKGDGNYVTGGGTNDSAAFLAAINAAVAPGGSHKVIVPAGVFRISSTVTKAFSTTHDLVIQGSGSGSIIFINTGAAANGFNLTSAYSITFRDVVFAGQANGEFTNDALVAVSLSGVLKATFENCAFYGIFAPGSIIKAIATDLLVSDSKFRGCTTSSAFNSGAVYVVNWIGVTVRDSDFFDYGDLHGVYMSKTPYSNTYAWITAETPQQEIIETVVPGTPPAANATSQRPVVVENCKFDEGALFSVGVTSNVGVGQPYTARVYLRGNNTNAASVVGGGGYYMQHVRRLEIDQSYVGYAHAAGNDVPAVDMYDVKEAVIRDSFFLQRANYINQRASEPLNLRIENTVYTSLVVNTVPFNLEILQEGRRTRRSLSAGTYTYAQLTPAVSNTVSYSGADVASAGTIAPTGNFFNLTETTTVSTITATGVEPGTQLSIKTTGALTFDEAGNLDISGGTSLTTSANQLVIAVWDGTKWLIR